MGLFSANAMIGAVIFGIIGIASHWLISKGVAMVPALKDEEEQQKRLRANAALLNMLRKFHYFGFPIVGFMVGPQLINGVFG